MRAIGGGVESRTHSSVDSIMRRQRTGYDRPDRARALRAATEQASCSPRGGHSHSDRESRRNRETLQSYESSGLRYESDGSRTNGCASPKGGATWRGHQKRRRLTRRDRYVNTTTSTPLGISPRSRDAKLLVSATSISSTKGYRPSCVAQVH